MYSFLKKKECSNKLIIQHKIALIQKQLNDLKIIINNNPDDDFDREYTVIFDALLSLENIRLYKLIHGN